MIFHNRPIFVSRSREHVYVLCVYYLGATGKMLFGRIAGSIEFAGSRDLPFDILYLLLPGGSLFLSCLPFFWNLAILLHISGMAHNRGPRRRLAWVGLIEHSIIVIFLLANIPLGSENRVVTVLVMSF